MFPEYYRIDAVEPGGVMVRHGKIMLQAGAQWLAAQPVSASAVRIGMFTLDERLILRNAGSPAAADREAVAAAFRKLLKRFA